MTGLELSHQFWVNIGKPRLQMQLPDVLKCAAVGLVGEGSDCFGYDDEISRDHDWGPGFCLWLTEEDWGKWGDALRRFYSGLPTEYLGWTRQHVLPQTAGRVGPSTVEGFFTRYIGMARRPESIREWRFIPESGLYVVTNGKVFQDPTGRFTEIREALLAYYPEELRKKKLARHCALAGQSGQYNYSRCLSHGEPAAAEIALGEFLQHIHAAVFLLNRRYRPYYKWADRAMRTLPRLGPALSPLLRRLALEPAFRPEGIEQVSAMVIEELRRQDLSASPDDFLLTHGEAIQATITDDLLRKLPLMAE